MTASAGAIDILVSADTAQASASLSKFAADAETQMARTAKANASAQKAGDAYVASLQRQLDTFGMTGSQIQQYEAKLKGVTDAANPLIARLQAMRDAQSAFNVQANATTSNLARSFEDTTTAAGHASGATSGITRELIVLGHEASQGNFTRLGGSLLVIAEYSKTAQAVIASMAGPVGAVVALLALFAVEAIRGAHELDTLNKSLLITGNYAGQTSSSFNDMVKAVAASSNSGFGAARDALQGLISTGQVGPKVLQQMAVAVDLVAQKTGKATEEVVADFATLTAAPAKWADEHNKAWNFISATQYAYIKNLDETGNKEQAALLTLKALTDHAGGKGATDVGVLAQAWKTFTLGLDVAAAKMKGLFSPDTAADAVDKAQARLQQLLDLQKDGSAAGPVSGANLDKLNAQIAAQRAYLGSLQDVYSQQQKSANDKSADEASQKEAINAKNRLDELDKRTKGVDLLKRALADLHRDQDNWNKANKDNPDLQLTPERMKAQEDQVRKDSMPKPDNSQSKLETAFTREMNSLGEQGAKLASQADSIAKYGKALDGTTAETEAFNIAQGKLLGTNGAALTQSQKMALLAQAAQNDAQREVNTAAAASSAIGEKVRAMNAEANARALSARDMFIAQQLADKELDNLKKTPSAYAAATAAISAAAGKLFDEKTVKPAFDQWDKSITDSIAKMAEETDSLTVSDVQRKKNIADLQLEAQYRALVLKFPEQQIPLEAKLSEAISKTNDEIERGNTVAKSFNTGAQSAFQKYQDGAANSAKYAEDFVGGSLSRIEDALVSFANTGKLSFSSLFQFMADEFIRQQARMLISSATTGSGGFFGSLLQAFGFGGTGLSTSQYSTSGFATGTNPNYGNEGGFSAPAIVGTDAAGGPVDPGSAYLVGERGPEVLQMGNSGGKIIPNGGGGSNGGGAIHFHNVYNIGQGVSRAEVVQAVQAGNAQQQHDLQRQKSRQTGVFR